VVDRHMGRSGRADLVIVLDGRDLQLGGNKWQTMSEHSFCLAKTLHGWEESSPSLGVTQPPSG
jgi:hypothetical protein